MVISNNDRAYLTLNRYAEKSVEAMEVWAAENGLDSFGDDLKEFHECCNDCGFRFFFGQLYRYKNNQETSRFNEMNLLFNEFTTDKIHDDEWYSSVWAQELPQTFNYLWEEGRL